MVSFDGVGQSRIADTLSAIAKLYEQVEQQINQGVLLSRDEIALLKNLAGTPKHLQTLEIARHPEISNNDFGKRWGVSYARISQIRHGDVGRRKYQLTDQSPPAYPLRLF
jgi:hypothetical protein